MASALKECRQLALISKARQQLEAAVTLDEVKEIRDTAEAIRRYYKAADDSLDAMNAAGEIKLRAERRAGEMLAEMEKNKGGRPAKTADTLSVVSLDDLGISHKQSSRWQKLASIPEADFDALVEHKREAREELTQASALRLAAATPCEPAELGPADWMQKIRRTVSKAFASWDEDSTDVLANYLRGLAGEVDDGTIGGEE